MVCFATATPHMLYCAACSDRSTHCVGGQGRCIVGDIAATMGLDAYSARRSNGGGRPCLSSLQCRLAGSVVGLGGKSGDKSGDKGVRRITLPLAGLYQSISPSFAFAAPSSSCGRQCSDCCHRWKATPMTHAGEELPGRAGVTPPG